MNKKTLMVAALAWMFVGGSEVKFSLTALGQTVAGSQPAIAKSIGTIKAINGNSLTLSPPSGGEVAVTVQPNARLLRLAPGDKDLKNATPVQLSELQVGDTVRVRGSGSEDGKSIAALEVIVITRAAVAAMSDQVKQDWQKRGMGGLVESVDPASGTVTVSISSLAGKKNVAVHTKKNTLIHRYAPDSARPEDARSATLQDIHPGDQLRARGGRSADGTEFTAEEIYAGVFPQFAATIKSVDASSGTITVQDLTSKKTVEVKVTTESQLHKIPAEMAQGFAARIKAMMPVGAPGSASTSSSTPAVAGADAGHSAGGTGNGARSGGAPDLQRMLSRMPSSTLADLNLQKGDAVVILSTEGTATSPRTAITLLSGVEPILQASPRAQAMMLTPWTLGGAPGGEQ